MDTTGEGKNGKGGGAADSTGDPSSLAGGSVMESGPGSGSSLGSVKPAADRAGGRIKPAPSWLGKRVGRFKLIALLGQGAMGRVFRGEDTLLSRHVALKVLPKTLKRGNRTIEVERLIREARAAATLEHPHVVQVYEVNESNGVHYIAMELIEGGSLYDLVKGSGPLDTQRACQLAAEAAEALAQAHAHGVIHRDVKPSNLMLTRTGRCKVGDFGLARIDDPNDIKALGGESVGTPQFVAPEILRGSPASARSDIYSLAATLWYLLVGRPPFEGDSVDEILRKHVSAPLPDLRQLKPDLPESLVKTIESAMSKSPNDRPVSAEQFGKRLRVHTIAVGSGSGMLIPGSGSFSALAALATGRPVAAPAMTASAAAPARSGTNPVLLWGGVAAGVALLLGVVAFVLNHNSGGNDAKHSLAARQPIVEAAEPPVEVTPAPASPATPKPSINAAAQTASAQTSKKPLVAAAPTHPGAIDLLKGLNLNVASVKGQWHLEGSGVMSDNSGPAMLEFPGEPPSEYDFIMEYTPQDCVEQLLFKPGVGPDKQGVAFNWCMNVGEWTGIESINGKHIFDNDAQGKVPRKVQAGVRHTSIVKVRDAGIEMWVDGEKIMDWRTDYSDLSRLDDWSMRDNNRLGIGSWNKPTIFHKVQLVDMTRSGK